MEFTYDEIIDILDVKYIAGLTKGYTLVPGIYEVTDIIMMLKSLLPEDVKVNITIDIVGLKSNLTTNETISFSKKSFIYVVLGFTHSHLDDLDDIRGFVQLIPGSYKSDKAINISGVDKNHLKCDCNNVSIVNGIREPNYIALVSVHFPVVKFIINQN